MITESFYQITMGAKNGKKLYLDMMPGIPTWTFDPEKACIWNDKVAAERFAKDWFKNFTNYKIEEVEIDVMKAL